MGSLIVRQVIDDLIPLGLGRSQGGELLLAGSSAGGLGVMLNLDKVKRFLREERNVKISVRGVSDSGWFLDREPFALGAISGSEVVKQGHALWEGSLPEACVAAYPTEPWRCYFGHRLYPFLKGNYLFQPDPNILLDLLNQSHNIINIHRFLFSSSIRLSVAFR